jgi:phage replication-related protein YjqB (UPF0714/DUF867 family)
VVVTVHGQLNQKEEFVMVGGLNESLGSEITAQLKAASFRTRPPAEGLMGNDPMNICNRGKSKQGVQLEVSRKVRDLLRHDRDHLKFFSDAVRKGIQHYLRGQQD